MAWFKRDKKRIENSTPIDERRVRTEGLWIKCDSCRAIIWKKDLQANWQVCTKCDHHFRLSSKRRLDLLLDDGLWTEHDAELISSDPLVFSDTKPYAKRLKDARDKLGMNDAIVTAEGTLSGRPVICCSMEFGFIGGSMGAVVGEKVARAIERNEIEVAPLAFMRGRSLNDSFIILDEAQNTTVEQMKMFLTRIGFGSRAVVTGDVTQTDLPAGRMSGLRHAVQVLRGVVGVAFTYFDAGDVVRHPLVQRIVQAYEAHSPQPDDGHGQ